MSPPIRVLLTGAAGQIGYELASMVARGDMFGPTQPVIMHLLDLPMMDKSLEGLAMELDDCSFPLLHGVVTTSDSAVAFKDIDAALMVGSMPRKQGMERKDLLSANVKIFKEQGAALDKYAKKTVKVVVVGNPANTNALVMSHFAPSIPKENITALTRLDSNRATSMVAKRLKVSCDSVKKVVIWGNHSNTQFVDASQATVHKGSSAVPVTKEINDDNWIKTVMLPDIQTRGAKVIEYRQKSSAMSAAKAVVDHMHDWWLGTKPGEWAIMSVPSDGSYNVPKELVFSFPVVISNGKYQIVKDIAMDDWAKAQFDKTLKELVGEKETALAACN